jgi:hypothetical protein
MYQTIMIESREAFLALLDKLLAADIHFTVQNIKLMGQFSIWIAGRELDRAVAISPAFEMQKVAAINRTHGASFYFKIGKVTETSGAPEEKQPKKKAPAKRRVKKS